MTPSQPASQTSDVASDIALDLPMVSLQEPPDPEPLPDLRIELALPPGMIPRLRRRGLVAGLPAGRSRSRPLRMIWHDTPDRALAADGLALVEEGGRMRLERLRPDVAPWPPGLPAPVLADPADTSHLAPTAPVAALEGRSTVLPLAAEGSGATLTVLDGALSAIGRASPVCRVLLDGAEGTVLGLARSLVTDLDAAIRPAALAAEALALASGTPPTPRRLGPPELRPGLRVGEAFDTVVAHLIDVLLHWSLAAGPERPEGVHQARVAMRRLRSALTVFRAATGAEPTAELQAGLKALGAVLGPTRDWDVFAAGLGSAIGEAFPEDAGVARLRRAAERRRLACYQALAAFVAGPAFRRIPLEGLAVVAGQGWRRALEAERRERMAADLADYAARVLERRHAGLAESGAEIADMDIPSLHALRLKAKRLRYAAEFFAPLFARKPARRYLRRLAALQEELGRLNDGAAAQDLLRTLGDTRGVPAEAIGLARGYAMAGSGALRPRILRAWDRFLSRDMFWP
jgi:CHAD domain-containing protein